MNKGRVSRNLFNFVPLFFWAHLLGAAVNSSDAFSLPHKKKPSLGLENATQENNNISWFLAP